MEKTYTGAANGEEHPITIKFLKEFDLSALEAKNREDDILLNFLNIIVKSAFRAKKFKQIGRLPKYFLA